MKFLRFTIFAICALSLGYSANATQADDTTITITAKNPGPTPFIEQLTLSVSDTDVIKSIQFTITPRTGSITRPLSGTYSSTYLLTRGYLQPNAKEIFLPIYGLYDNYTNAVTLTYLFNDGSSKQGTTTITTAAFADPCGYNNPTVLQARTGKALSYDFILISETCNGDDSPAIIDTDSHLRWVGPAGFSSITSGFFDSAVYITYDKRLFRIEMDGTVTFLHDYGDININYFYHNIDVGKSGMILEANTTAYVEAENIEVDLSGNVLKVWNMADIISQAMIAGGDDPSTLVYPAPNDWFHNNAAAYNPADNSVIISSRQNFLICIDYDTSAIKWILGDPTKEWYQFPSLRKYALTLADGGSLPPIGQHAVSYTYDQHVLVMDNGQQSSDLLIPQGTERDYATPRKYKLDLDANVATEVWNYPLNESVFSPLCGSVYEDAPLNYLVDYAVVNGYYATDAKAELLGLDATGAQAFYYQYPTTGCEEAYNSRPLHLETTKFPSIGPQAENVSTRGTVSADDTTLIAGFIVTGTSVKTVALRVLGPSLSKSGVTNTVTDPTLTLYDSTGKVIATNDDWATDPQAVQLTADGLAPTNPAEAATIQDLAPGAYTMVARGKGTNSGIGLVEAYDLSPSVISRLANISTRGYVGTGDNNLISGFIVGDVGKATVTVRALGPSLAPAISNVLSDPTLTVYDSNGTALVTNDDWQDDYSADALTELGLAPTNPAESATILHLPAGAYSVVVSGSNNSVGTGLVEVYDLD